MDLQLAGRLVVVTGGSSGIGRATVRLLLEEGACVATCARDGARLAAAHQDLAPEAVMNAAYTGPQRELLGTDNGGHCSIWGNWPN